MHKILSTMKFIHNFSQDPPSVGAILPSSKRLAKKMINNIDFSKADCIVEYGPGTGVFTEQIVKKLGKNSKLLCFETNNNFCNFLKEKFNNNNNVIIINDSAENVTKYLKSSGIETVSHIISGLPFSSLPSNICESIFSETKKVLSTNGTFNIFQYTPLKFHKIKKHFSFKLGFEMLNLFPAFVLYCKQKNN